MTTHGEADSYYNGGNGQAKQGYPMQPPIQYPQQPMNNAYQQPPPNYGQDFQNSAPPQMAGADGKQSFDQAFKLERPNYNDLWAGILV